MNIARFAFIAMFCLIIFGCELPTTNSNNDNTGNEANAIPAQEQTDADAAMEGGIKECVSFIKKYPKSKLRQEVINRYFKLIKTGTTADCIQFLELLPKDSHATEVKELFEQLKENEDFEQINSQTPKDDLKHLSVVADMCQNFISNFPKSKKLDAVKQKYLEFIKFGPSTIGLGFLKAYPKDKLADEVKSIVNAKFEEEIYALLEKGEITLDQCKFYLEKYPEGKYRKEFADNIFKQAEVGSMEACNLYIEVLPNDERITDVKKIKSDLELKETMAIFDKFVTSKTLKWKLELKNSEFTIKDGEYQIQETIVVAESAKLIIQPGTTLNFASNTGIICYGIIEAQALAERKITFCALNDNVWNNITFIGKKSSESLLKQAVISGGKGISTNNDLIAKKFDLKNEYFLGGSILCANEASPMIESCEFKSNALIEGKTVLGGGVCCWGSSSPIITNCIIAGNTAAWGGGLYIFENSNPVFTDCSISENNAALYAGGVCIINSNPKFVKTIINKNICENKAEMHGGGGVYCTETKAEFENCEINENKANSGAGVYLAKDASPKFTETLINLNVATFRGAGVLCTSENEPVFVKCEIMKNNAGAKEFGGGIDCYDSKSNPDVKEENNNIVKDNVPRDFYFE